MNKKQRQQHLQQQKLQTAEAAVSAEAATAAVYIQSINYQKAKRIEA